MKQPRRTHQRSARRGSVPRRSKLGAYTEPQLHIALGRALKDVQSEILAARDAGSDGACLDMGSAIDRAWYNLGRADANYLALGGDASDQELDAISSAQRAIRTTDNKFEAACVRRKRE